MITQEKLVIPFLWVISLRDGLSTGEIRDAIEPMISLADIDIESNPSQEEHGIPRWHQIVNNLKSNKVLEKRGLAEYFNRRWFITDEGRAILEFDASKKAQAPVVKKEKHSHQFDLFINVEESDFKGERRGYESNTVHTDADWSSDVKQNYNNKCALTNVSESLESAHIVPRWSDPSVANDRANGICLRVDIHRLFEKGYISFDKYGYVMVSLELNDDIELYGISEVNRLSRLEPSMEKYLYRHRTGIFKK